LFQRAEKSIDKEYKASFYKVDVEDKESRKSSLR
jgi:hypothetical protein